MVSDDALQFWQERFSKHGVEQEDIINRVGRQTLRFKDAEGQRLMLVSDETNEGVAGGTPREHEDS